MGNKPKQRIKRPNGRAKAARGRVLATALKQGKITHAQARKIGKWSHGLYHLNKLAEAGLLKHAGYNLWRPTRRAANNPDAVI
jgi:hypothetical protein